MGEIYLWSWSASSFSWKIAVYPSKSSKLNKRLGTSKTSKRTNVYFLRSECRPCVHTDKAIFSLSLFMLLLAQKQIWREYMAFFFGNIRTQRQQLSWANNLFSAKNAHENSCIFYLTPASGYIVCRTVVLLCFRM